MKPERLALAAHVDQMARNAGKVKGESDDNHRVESNDHPRDIGCGDCRGSTRTNRSKQLYPLLHVASGATCPPRPPMIYVNGYPGRMRRRSPLACSIEAAVKSGKLVASREIEGLIVTIRFGCRPIGPDRRSNYKRAHGGRRVLLGL